MLYITETETRYELANRLTDIDIKMISIVPKGANREPFILVKSADKTDKKGKTPTIIGDSAMNSSMSDIQKLQSALYKLAALQDGSSHGQAKSVNSDVARLCAQVAKLSAQIEMVKAGLPKGQAQAAPVEKAAGAGVSFFASAGDPITKSVGGSGGFWPARFDHYENRETTAIIKSSTAHPLEREEVKLPVKKSVDTSIFAGCFPSS